MSTNMKFFKTKTILLWAVDLHVDMIKYVSNNFLGFRNEVLIHCMIILNDRLIGVVVFLAASTVFHPCNDVKSKLI